MAGRLLACHDGSVRWAIQAVANPSVLRLHTAEELTDRTIVTCPPALPPAPLELLSALPGVRTLNLHRYRCRVNLRPEADAIASAHAGLSFTTSAGDTMFGFLGNTQPS